MRGHTTRGRGVGTNGEVVQSCGEGMLSGVKSRPVRRHRGMDEVSTVSWAGSAGTATASLWVDGTDCRSQRLVSQPQGVACVAAARAIATTVSGARMLR
jgi:hypothetical protein